MARKRIDTRPICDCRAYSFPHRIGGRCSGSTFVEFYYIYDRSSCDSCNCNANGVCEVEQGIESIKEAECYTEAWHYSPGEHLPLELEEFFEEEEPYESS